MNTMDIKTRDGEAFEVALVGVRVKSEVFGNFQKVKVRQHFINKEKKAIEAGLYAANIPEEKLYLITEDQMLIYSVGSNSVETIDYLGS